MTTAGPFELQVLAAITRLGGRSYGMKIRKEVEGELHRTVSIGQIYTTLNRLEDKGWVSSELGEPTAIRGGRAKRYFQLETAGQQALDETLAAARALLGRLGGQPA